MNGVVIIILVFSLVHSVWREFYLRRLQAQLALVPEITTAAGVALRQIGEASREVGRLMAGEKAALAGARETLAVNQAEILAVMGKVLARVETRAASAERQLAAAAAGALAEFRATARTELEAALARLQAPPGAAPR